LQKKNVMYDSALRDFLMRNVNLKFGFGERTRYYDINQLQDKNCIYIEWPKTWKEDPGLLLECF